MHDLPPSRTLWLVRYGVPIGLVIAGFVILGVDHSTTGAEGWAMLTGAAGAIALLNGLFRIGVLGDAERAEEATARDYLDEHGGWPEDEDDAPRGRRWVLAKGVVTPEMEEAEARAEVEAAAAARAAAAAEAGRRSGAGSEARD